MIYVAITTIRSFPEHFRADAIKYALDAREEGKRSEVLTEQEKIQRFPIPMQDLTTACKRQ